MYFTVKQPWGMQKPVPGSQIDWGHPLARGLVGCWLFNEGAGKSIAELTAGSNGLATGGFKWTTAHGLGGTFATDAQIPVSGSRYNLTTGYTITASAAITEGLLFWAYQNSGAYPGYALRCTSETWRLYNNNGGWKNGPAVSATVPQWISASNSGTIQWIANRVVSAPVAAGLPSSWAGTKAIGGTSGGYMTGTIWALFIHDFALSINDMIWLQSEPYAMIQAPEMPVFYSIPAGGSSIAAIRYHYERLRMSA